MYRLYFLKAAAHPFNPSLDPDRDDYYEVQGVPARELVSTQVVDALEYMLEQTNKPEWRRRCRRQATIGDVVTHKKNRYVIVESEHLSAYVNRGDPICLPLWRQFDIVRLHIPGEANGWFAERSKDMHGLR